MRTASGPFGGVTGTSRCSGPSSPDAGLHAAAYFIEDQSKLDSVTTVLTVVIAGTVIVLGTAVGLATAGVTMAVCLVVVMLAPVVTVVGLEVVGHRHADEAVSRSLS